MPNVQLIIRGRVQGVFYRHSTRQKAQELGLNGWVKNCPDGTVAIEVSGPRARVEELIQWCWQGPPAAVVHWVEVSWLGDETVPEMHHAGFEVR